MELDLKVFVLLEGGFEEVEGALAAFLVFAGIAKALDDMKIGLRNAEEGLVGRY